MNKKRSAVSASKLAASLLGLSALLTLSGCQLLTGFQQIEAAENAEVWSEQIIPITGEVNIACAGTYHCEITQIDKTLVISTETHRPVDSALLVPMAGADGRPYAKLSKSEQAKVQMDTIPLVNNKSVKIVPLSASSIPGLVNYYARVKPIKREVHINFYPENNVGYIERFALIDEFKESGTYLLQAYRQKPSPADGTLLATASPTPLCIDLLKDNLLQRRFCKQMDSEHQGEFVENSLPIKRQPNSTSITKLKVSDPIKN